METQHITIPTILLTWSDWTPWECFETGQSDLAGVRLPTTSGVYEVKYQYSEERLTIGKASNLNNRVRRALVQGKQPHSAGKRIRSSSEDRSQLVIRWAETDRPAAAEEELHRLYYERHSILPKYTRSTR